MELRELFDMFMNEYQNGDHETAIYYGMEWISCADENPFELDTPERHYFFKAKQNLKKWDAGGIDYRISRTRLIHNLEDLGKLNLLNPYKPIDPTFRVLGVIPDDKVEEKIPEKKEEVKEEKRTEQNIINKEDKPKEEAKLIEKIKQETKPVEVKKTEEKTIKEIKEDVSNDRRKKHFFGGRKKEAEEERHTHDN